MLTKFKDTNPVNTVKKIRGILQRLNINTEISHIRSLEDYHSIHLSVKGISSIFSNGKGTSYNFALASAYAEFMERLQNNYLYRKFMHNPANSKYNGFYLYPDEIYLKAEELRKHERQWVDIILQENNEWSNIIDKCIELENWKPDSLVALPFYNCQNSEISYLPAIIIDFIYGSNGMCAGNTTEEALVQGISEIFERHFMFKLYKERTNPPQIPDNYIKMFPRIRKMIAAIEEEGYHVSVRDCSFNKGLPVIGIIFINKDKKSYRWKFGAHPCFEYAIERTLTEFLQGKRITEVELVNFDSSNSHLNNISNLNDIFTFGGYGHFPVEAFSANYSYSFKQYPDFPEDQYTNRDLLEYLMSIIKREGLKLLIRDVSYLGFPSYHVIIPGLSETYLLDLDNVESQLEYKKIASKVMALPNLNNRDLLTIKDYLEKNQYSYNSLGDLVNLPVEDDFVYKLIKKDFFDFCVNYKTGSLEEAYLSISKFIANTNFNEYYSCVQKYLGCQLNRFPANQTSVILSNFYPQELIAKAINNLSEPTEIFNDLAELNCWDCPNCTYLNSCCYTQLEKLIRTLKDYYSKNKIAQTDLKNIMKI